jgi:hypothetical protein
MMSASPFIDKKVTRNWAHFGGMDFRRRAGKRVGVCGGSDRQRASGRVVPGDSDSLRIFSARRIDALGTITLTLLAAPIYIPNVLLVFGPIKTAETPRAASRPRIISASAHASNFAISTYDGFIPYSSGKAPHDRIVQWVVDLEYVVIANLGPSRERKKPPARGGLATRRIPPAVERRWRTGCLIGRRDRTPRGRARFEDDGLSAGRRSITDRAVIPVRWKIDSFRYNPSHPACAEFAEARLLRR